MPTLYGEGTACLMCGHPLNASTPVDGSDRAAGIGTLAICSHCGELHQVTSVDPLRLGPYDIDKLDLESRAMIVNLRRVLLGRPPDLPN